MVTREVICADACEWLNKKCSENDLLPGSVFTSLPDISEITKLFAGLSDDERIRQYESWFVHQAVQIMSLLNNGEYAIFLQSDVRVQRKTNDKRIMKWIDKSYLCTSAAYKTNCSLLWHKLVHVGDIDARSAGRPGYSHLLCYGKEGASYTSGEFATPDIFYRGEMLWPKGIGIDCCLMGVAFLAHVGKTKVIVDPFCGMGTVLAMANALGVSSLGVEISSKRCRKARTLRLNDFNGVLSRLSPGRMSILGLLKHNQPKLIPSAEISLDESYNDEVDDYDGDDKGSITEEDITEKDMVDPNKIFFNNVAAFKNKDKDKNKNKYKKKVVEKDAMEKFERDSIFHRVLLLMIFTCCAGTIIHLLLFKPKFLTLMFSPNLDKWMEMLS